MKQKIIIACAFAAVILVAGYFLALPSLTGSAIKKTLHGMGFTTATIENTQSASDGIALNGITLDAKKLNTIQSVTIRDTPDGKTMTINKMALTGDWEKTSMPDIAGMSLPIDIAKLARALRAQGIKYVVLNGAQIDLIMPLAGVVTVQAKGQLVAMPDGSARLQATLWSDQKQVKGQVNVTGEFSPSGTSSVDFEIADAKIELNALIASRIGGWMIFNRTNDTAPWGVSAQIDAGSARVYTALMRSATLSVQGTTRDANISLQASGMEDGTSIAMDMKLSKINKSMVTVIARTTDMRGLINGILSSRGPGDPSPPATALTPGGDMTYHAQTSKIGDLFDTGKLTLVDAQGKVWMNSVLRKTETGFDLDVQEAAMKNFANILGIEKLSTDGLMTGLLNLHGNDHGGVVIEQGLIRSATSGVLSLDARKLSPKIETARKDALDLLKSFAYDRIEITVSSAEEGLDADIRMSGHPLLSLNQNPVQIDFHFEGEI